MSIPNVVIIGRPNAGKSTLFNRLTGKRRALVHEQPGTTRDRNEEPIRWKGKNFLLVDTGGWEDNSSVISVQVKKQMNSALEKADAVLFVVDGKNGYHPVDGEISNIIRRRHKNVITVVNKIDSPKDEPKAGDFYRMGLGDIHFVSATHGLLINELLDAVAARIPDSVEPVGSMYEQAIKIALVGKPNVGKSSLLNALVKEERSIVNDKPGTTRESVDIYLERKDQNFVVIDTPGLHRKHKFTDDMEYLSALSAHQALERAEVAVLVIDPIQGIGETEARISQSIIEEHCACLIVINKWDMVDGREEQVKSVRNQLEQKLPFMWWSKVIFVSAKTGQRTERILEEVQKLYVEFSRIVPDDDLNDVVRAAVQKRPFSRHGKMLKIMKVFQAKTKPPHFIFQVNQVELAHFSYRRYIENVLREKFGFEGTPIILTFKK